MIRSFQAQQQNRIHRRLVYISGPLTSSGTPSQNVARAIEVAKHLIELGYAPVCPHLTYFIDPDERIKHSVWMEIDLPLVARMDAVIRLCGPSNGADQECREAFNRGIPIFPADWKERGEYTDVDAVLELNKAGI